ncbi:alkaline shock response membrane anchor protein AmaP [Streptomyces sp. NA04227]|uniref:alkaline shock response membrane anchor protein AmaP n=1 Tax=Streptomyces sp. NA04227 TaxID=2742136 RepID=UPI00159179FD|nr:alkaline shock response membrane anchor protein AmaP [Streptomyces sp. NA04227]QKW05774.1 alkaline shock response membrane anchor protein AmaP [Streptomyces sp. NA04227]
MTGTLNRLLLALVGLILLALGGSVLAVGLGADPPSWWIHGSEKDVLLSEAERHRWHDEGWWWWVVIGILALLLLFALGWLASTLRTRRLSDLLVDTRDDDSALLRGRALEDALAGEVGQYDSVAGAKVSLTGHRDTPRARIRLRLEPQAVPAETLHRVSTEALSNARRSAGLKNLPAEVRLRTVSHRAERVT